MITVFTMIPYIKESYLTEVSFNINSYVKFTYSSDTPRRTTTTYNEILLFGSFCFLLCGLLCCSYVMILCWMEAAPLRYDIMGGLCKKNETFFLLLKIKHFINILIRQCLRKGSMYLCISSVCTDIQCDVHHCVYL